MDLSIIIVNYNTENITENCINSILDNLERLKYEIILVDNHSETHSIHYLEDKFNANPRIKIIKNKANLGFGRANNIGIDASIGEFLLLLNSDTIVTGNSIENLYEFYISNDKSGLISAQLYNEDGSEQNTHSGFPDMLVFMNSFRKINYYFNKKYVKKRELNNNLEVHTIYGACMFFSRKIYDELGAFDENYFFYFEDMDFCRKVYEAGYKNYVVRSSKIFHLRGASSLNAARASKLFNQSRYYYYKKYYGNYAVNILKIWDKTRCLPRLLFYGLLIAVTVGRHKYYIKKIKQYYTLLRV